MKLLLNFVILQCLVISETKGNSVDAVLGKRYQFELFENSEGCAQVYSQEAEVVLELMKLKNKLRRMLYIMKIYESNKSLRALYGIKQFLTVSNVLNSDGL